MPTRVAMTGGVQYDLAVPLEEMQTLMRIGWSGVIVYTLTTGDTITLRVSEIVSAAEIT